METATTEEVSLRHGKPSPQEGRSAGRRAQGGAGSRHNQRDQQVQCERAAIVWRSDSEGPHEPWDTPWAPSEDLTGQGTSGPQTTGLSEPRWLWQCDLAGLWHPGASYFPG